MEKPVDKRGTVWYSNKAVAAVNTEAGHEEKVVDKQQAIWYPIKVADEQYGSPVKNF